MIFGTPNSTFLENRLASSTGMPFSSATSLSSGVDQMMNELNIQQPTSHTVLFDLSWEVAKKVGGIYTVLKTKAPVTVEEYKSRYALIGPYNPDTAPTEFEPLIPGPLSSPIIENMMKKYGIHVHFGKWLVEGYPKVFLIDLHSSMHKLGEWRWDLMSGFEQPGDNETNETIVFGYQSALLLKEFAEANPNDKYIAHFHEWQASVGLILLKKWKVPVSTIFTTHATLLGRYLAAGGVDLYNQMQNLNMDFEASKRGIYHRHWIEKKSAADSHVFTTVSEITGYESEHILMRKPDVILPNGLKLDRFTALHEFQNLHAKYKGILNEFVRGHFYGHYSDFDLDNTLYVFTAGRHEYFNKGVDMFLDSLAGLNKLLQQSGSKMTVVAFIIMPAATNNFNVESLKGHSYLKDMRRTCNTIVEAMGERLFEATSRGKMISPEELLSQEDIVMLKRRIFALKQKASGPPVVTHNMINDNDEILQHIRKIKLFNSQEDRVKIIYHPEFLTSTNPLIPLDYTEFVRGCHLGIFPSYYEPFGMTPAECCASGCPSITSNLTGFANYMSRALPDTDSKGIFIVDRRFKSSKETVDQMTQYLWKFTQLDRRQRIELRNATEKLSELLDWRTLGKFYKTARALALERAFPPKPISRSPSPSPSSSLKLSSGLSNAIELQQQQQSIVTPSTTINLIPPSSNITASTSTSATSTSATSIPIVAPKSNVIPINTGKENISLLSPSSMSSLLSDSLNESKKQQSKTPSTSTSTSSTTAAATNKPVLSNPTPTPSPNTSSFIPTNKGSATATTSIPTSNTTNGKPINPFEALSKSNSSGNFATTSTASVNTINGNSSSGTNSPVTKSIPIPSSKSLK
ncbi:hypothetical protein RB653_007849 [Dictyostelium firmibasis]|uniref:Glycogen [starch] synthase n=1 Tax=Dictyostelium firmibasis TaxID=79012 RepID=A0AAN7U1V6_9MYCE